MTLHRSTPWRHWRDQMRLLWAEKLLGWSLTTAGWASDLAPAEHQDSIAIHRAVRVIATAVAAVATRPPAGVAWRCPVMVPCDLPKPPCRVLDVAAVIEDGRLLVGHQGILAARKAGATHVRIKGVAYDVSGWAA